jgi:hypothetical protein
MLVRWLVIGGVAVLALTVYALVDLFVTQSARVRGFPKPVWIAVIVVLPLLGPILWLFVGKNRRMPKQTTPMFPDDDMGFLGRIDRESAEDRIRRLEEELRQLDEEDLGGTNPSGDTGNKKPKKNKNSNGDGSGDATDGDASGSDADDDGDGPVGGAGTPSSRS